MFSASIYSMAEIECSDGLKMVVWHEEANKNEDRGLQLQIFNISCLKAWATSYLDQAQIEPSGFMDKLVFLCSLLGDTLPSLYKHYSGAVYLPLLIIEIWNECLRNWSIQHDRTIGCRSDAGIHIILVTWEHDIWYWKRPLCHCRWNFFNSATFS